MTYRADASGSSRALQCLDSEETSVNMATIRSRTVSGAALTCALPAAQPLPSWAHPWVPPDVPLRTRAQVDRVCRHLHAWTLRR